MKRNNSRGNHVSPGVYVEEYDLSFNSPKSNFKFKINSSSSNTPSSPEDIPEDGCVLCPELLEIAGTAIVYNTNTSKLCAIAGEAYNTMDYPQDIYEPVGVVIMPASHTEDGIARMVSLKMMGVKTLDDGSITYGAYDGSNVSEFDNGGRIAWTSPNMDECVDIFEGLYNTNLLPSLSKQPSVSSSNPYEIKGNNGYVYYTNYKIENSQTSWVGDEQNEGHGWNVPTMLSNQVSSILMPSPYLSDGTPNIAMRVTGTSMGIIHGKEVSNIVNEYSDKNGKRFDVFKSAKEYSTNGTKSGDWYVPSTLELSYLCAKAYEINTTLFKMNPYIIDCADGNIFTCWTSIIRGYGDAWKSTLPVMNFFLFDPEDLSTGQCFAVAPITNDNK